MPKTTFEKWILGILAAVIASTIIGGIAWAQTVRADIAVLQERTSSIAEMQNTLRVIAVDIAAIRSRVTSSDVEVSRRLDRIERSLEGGRNGRE